jgi:hypothetical protein
VISQLIKTTMDLPPRIQAICWAQFWAWIGKILPDEAIVSGSNHSSRVVPFPFLQYYLGW